MKRLIIVFVALLVCVPCTEARRKSKKAGTVKDGTYVDAKYAFQVDLTEGWKYKLGKASDQHRFSITQSTWEAPAYLLETPDLTKIPKLTVWADTTSLPPMEFIDSLVSPTFRSAQTREIMKEFEILQSETNREDVVRRERGLVPQLEDYQGVRWVGRVEYTATISLIPSDPNSAKKYVKGAYGGTIVGAKHGDVLILFHLISEWEFHEQLQRDALKMIQTLKFADEEKDG